MRRPTALVAVGVLLLGACGDDGDESGGGRASRYSEAMAESMAADEELPFTRSDIECLSVEFVDALGGPERLEEEGIEPSDLRGDQGLDDLGLELGDDEAEGLAGAFGACDVSLAELVLDQAGEDVPAEVRTCVEDNLDEDVLARFFGRVLLDDAAGEEAPEELLDPLLQCF